jgi:hypothetical protein
MLTFGITLWEETQRVMAAKLIRLTHKIEIQLHLVADSCTICSSHSRWQVWKLLDTPWYVPPIQLRQFATYTNLMWFICNMKYYFGPLSIEIWMLLNYYCTKLSLHYFLILCAPLQLLTKTSWSWASWQIKICLRGCLFASSKYWKEGFVIEISHCAWTQQASVCCLLQH